MCFSISKMYHSSWIKDYHEAFFLQGLGAAQGVGVFRCYYWVGVVEEEEEGMRRWSR